MHSWPNTNRFDDVSDVGNLCCHRHCRRRCCLSYFYCCCCNISCCNISCCSLVVIIVIVVVFLIVAVVAAVVVVVAVNVGRRCSRRRRCFWRHGQYLHLRHSLLLTLITLNHCYIVFFINLTVVLKRLTDPDLFSALLYFPGFQNSSRFDAIATRY